MDAIHGRRRFSQAKPKGEDIRFFGDGKPLAYQIEEWDAAKGAASIWVRIPVIQGNSRQEIKLYWGKSAAASESSGSAVFNESNGYLSVWHLSDPDNPAAALTFCQVPILTAQDESPERGNR